MKHHHRSIILAAAFAVLPQTRSSAGDFSGDAFSLRYSAALTHFEPYADVQAKGGASAASLWGSSNNPAAMPWMFPDVQVQGSTLHYEAGFSGQYSNVSFENGTDLNFSSGSVTVGTQDTGIFRIDAGLINSNSAQVRNLPADFGFDLGGVRLNYAKKLSADLSLGASAGFGISETTFSSSGLNLVDATKDIWNFRLGGVWSPQQSNWLFGLVSTYIYGPTDTTTLAPLPTGGLLRRSFSDATQQFTVQPGIAYKLAPDALINLDYQLATLSDSTGRLTENRFMAGTDIKICDAFRLRAGGFTDVQGHAGWTAGIGFYPSPHVLIDLAYQNNNFPEVGQEFGRSRTLNASVSIQW